MPALHPPPPPPSIALAAVADGAWLVLPNASRRSRQKEPGTNVVTDEERWHRSTRTNVVTDEERWHP